MRPLGAKETAAYVAGRIRAAGGAGGQVFTREAVALICKHSRGFPRLINVIADNALLGGFAAGKRPVGSDIVREICGDTDIEAASTSPVPATADVNNGPLFGAFAATPALSSQGEDAGTVAQAVGPPVQEPAASDTSKVDSLWQPDDREVQEIFFNI